MTSRGVQFRMLGSIVAMSASLLVGGSVVAQQSDPAASYPSESIRIVVTVSAGGGVDPGTRIVGGKNRPRWGEPGGVEDPGGGGGHTRGGGRVAGRPDRHAVL